MSISVIGLQWGDEGKGKVSDRLASDYVDVVVRYAGGANAGHTVIHKGKKAVFHLLPSAVLNKNKVFVLGSRMVIDPDALVSEIQCLQSGFGVKLTPENFKVSSRAHVVLKEHMGRDMDRESKRDKPIGTTCRGIGPAHEDKAIRCGLRLGQLMSYCDIRVREETREFLRPFVTDTVRYLGRLDKGKTVLYEGAQGVMLDIDYGTYPYVTSGCVLPPPTEKSIGVFGAYCTRVGEGPFPSEMLDEEQASAFRERTGEFGATTGRPRRIGWLDLPTLKYAIHVSGTNRLAMTKLDNLSGMEKIKVCIGHSTKPCVDVSMAGDNLERVLPVYETLEGWEPFDGVKSVRGLPKAARRYVDFVQENLGMYITAVSIGPRSDQLIFNGNMRL